MIRGGETKYHGYQIYYTTNFKRTLTAEFSIRSSQYPAMQNEVPISIDRENEDWDISEKKLKISGVGGLNLIGNDQNTTFLRRNSHFVASISS